ncbi:LysR family transcriptional regulator [Pseudoalteromonas luteoviolacea]|uniref:HTH-type transcriptional regulator MetR n=1 Tax=Pseudoalteromonas luteoviolacea H33 TaxID=1365251 RepID=A0A167DE71_9GAMM|nr:LysR family transcriptional regulator [Pseudoalteromonas luteoviolacea]KZN48725.1 LysR family transcriptional regulator [Pseudoalteromonas luteoviolacea H33]KZN75440.1 LysR family transcriptional regulator [Pseudoalteromonas luteoviolacea H33-S]MBQ4878640.1 LysR family transcriptional regulator [Pseudoalteromonas luteoviolacea]MBQ4907180.1 LysR family transcriptional regulator [Pseudoalteromonas luteoviolacea]
MLERIHLRIIHAVHQQGSLTAAAKELCVTQSALSHTMRKLEDNLGTAVWVRDGRSLRLTQAGHYLLNIANRALPLLNGAEERLKQIAMGERGTLRIGMECHPCYQWLLKVVSPFLETWPGVDVDVKQKFQFGGVGALLDYEIDLLVTPDPYFKSGLVFEPVFDYEQVLVVPKDHKLTAKKFAQAEDLRDQVLFTYPVSKDRLDIYTQFLNPDQVIPKQHKTVETTDIMLQMVACGRGVAALPRWLAEEYSTKLPLSVVRLGKNGIAKQIYLGTREGDSNIDYLSAFIKMAQCYKHPVAISPK